MERNAKRWASSTLAIVLVGALCPPLSARGQEASPPLPEWTDEGTPLDNQELLPIPSEDIPLVNEAFEEAEVQITQPEDIPDLPVIQAPADGEAPPELPDIPGLVKPKIRVVPSKPSGNPQIDPATGEVVPDSGVEPLPLPEGVEMASRVKWYPSPREARTVALAEKKHMLFWFGGPQWSPACKALNNDVFTSEVFNSFAAKNLVLTFLNVPSGATAASDPLALRQRAAIKKFRSFFRVRSLPTLILFDPEGREVDRIVGYTTNRDRRAAASGGIIRRISEMVMYEVGRRKKIAERRIMLAEKQGYRIWRSQAESTLFAKLSGTREGAVVLMDENGKELEIPTKLLALGDQELVRRRYAQSVVARSEKDAASEDFPPRDEPESSVQPP